MGARRQTLDTQAEVFRIFYEIGKALAQGQGYDKIVHSVVRAATRLTGGDAGSVLVLDPDTGNLIHREGHGLSGAERTISFAPGEGLAGWVAKHGRPTRVGDVRTDRRFVRKAVQRMAIRSMLCVPVKAKARVVGVLTVTSMRRAAFGASDARLLEALAAQVALDLENARLEALAAKDPLTGIANRRRFDETLARSLLRARRARTPVGVVMLDIDHFKTVNDVYGHAEGDRVLRQSVERWTSAIRAIDLLARVGGEEFAVILPGADAHRAREVGERLRQRQAQRPFLVRRGSVPLPVTVSVGVAVAARGAGSAAKLLALADKALYEAKRAGRNRVVLAGAASTSASGRRRRRSARVRRRTRRASRRSTWCAARASGTRRTRRRTRPLAPPRPRRP